MNETGSSVFKNPKIFNEIVNTLNSVRVITHPSFFDQEVAAKPGTVQVSSEFAISSQQKVRSTPLKILQSLDKTSIKLDPLN